MIEYQAVQLIKIRVRAFAKDTLKFYNNGLIMHCEQRKRLIPSLAESSRIVTHCIYSHL